MELPGLKSEADTGVPFSFFILSNGHIKGLLYWLQKEVWLLLSLWENDSNFYLISRHIKPSLDEFVVSISSNKSSSIQHDGHFEDYGAILEWSRHQRRLCYGCC